MPGEFEDLHGDWLRWVDAAGNLLLTGLERADHERERADRLAARLTEPGLDHAFVDLGPFTKLLR